MNNPVHSNYLRVNRPRIPPIILNNSSAWNPSHDIQKVKNNPRGVMCSNRNNSDTESDPVKVDDISSVRKNKLEMKSNVNIPKELNTPGFNKRDIKIYWCSLEVKCSRKFGCYL